jgi:metallo-beta-lactamase family protein
MGLTLSFLGGAGTVTGSRYLLEHEGKRILVDCGLFQGLKQLRLRNWGPFPVEPAGVSAIVLTHAHLDHSGYLPALVRDGFKGPVYCSSATKDLCGILLRDSAHLQEQDAEYANRHRFSKHKPALPLYTTADAERALTRLSPLPFDREQSLPHGAKLRLRHAGHILGAAILELEWSGTRVVFSGDLGRYDDPLMLDPAVVQETDYLLVESTYGNRRHESRDPQQALAGSIERTVGRGGTVVIPAFAVGRAQALLFHLERLKAGGKLRNVPIFLNSPMATDASEILCHHMADQRLSAEACRRACGVARYVRSIEESKALNEDPTPKVIVSASGMATGGRVLHHLKRYAPDPRSTILFAGFQAAGSRGSAMVSGATTIKIHGEYIPVRAEVDNLPMLSAHADADEIMKWLGNFRSPPRTSFITHGEPTASDALRRRIQDELGWTCKVPEQLERAELA